MILGTPVDKEFIPGPGRVFVFGSNLAGRHGGGAAKDAHRLYGAILGKGVGYHGNSYAIPTKDQYLNTLDLSDIRTYVNEFIKFATDNRDLYFFVTRIGCGLAGYSDSLISPLFYKAPKNCELPYGWEYD
jgi:hypothetical protein